MSDLIQSNDLVKLFHGIRALDGLTLSVENTTAIGLVGPNGAGKTTFFSLVCGFLRPTSGLLTVMGQKPDSSGLKGRIGLLPQDIPLMRGISVSSQLYLFAKLQGLNSSQARSESRKILEKLEIVNLEKQYPETLSYGQRKKVFLAQALIGQPDLILLDEPTSGLDPVAGNEVRQLIHDLRSKHTIIISSHNLDEIKNVCSEIIVINKGKLIKHCAISELIEQNNSLRVHLGRQIDDTILQFIQGLPEVVRVEQDKSRQEQVSIYFNDENPDQFQFRILESFQKKGIPVIEFSRGAIFTEKVVDLVKDR